MHFSFRLGGCSSSSHHIARSRKLSVDKCEGPNTRERHKAFEFFKALPSLMQASSARDDCFSSHP